MKYYAKLVGGESYWSRGIDFRKEVEQEVNGEHAEYLKGRADLFEVREDKPKAKKNPAKKTEEKVGE